MNAVIADYRTADMSDKLRALLDWVVMLTLHPSKNTESNVLSLRNAGWTDEEISSACFVASYFNFINRVADGLGVDHESFMHDHSPLPPCPWVDG